MMTIQTVILIVVSTLLFSTIYASDPCRFEYAGKGVIDITTLGRIDGKAAYADRVPSSETNYKYSYNPCKPFSEPPSCENVAACQIALDGRYYFTIGVQESATWHPGSETDNTPSITYTHDEKKTIVKLQCSTTGEEDFEALGEEPTNHFTFRITHKCACWNGCSSTPSTTTTTTTMTPSMNPCRFEYPGKGVIDFSFIGRTDQKAAYTDETTRAASNFKYSYNPCRSFSEGTSCIGVSVCQISNDEKSTFTLGTQESASWNPGSDLDTLPSVNYAYADRKVTVLLQCSTEGNNEFQAFGEDPVNNYKFQLTHKCACWNGCSSALSTTTTITTTTAITTTSSAHKPKWHLTGSLIEPRMDPTATLLNDGRVLVVGGGTSHFLKSAELYDAVTGNWTTTGSMNEERARHTASLLADGRVLIVGGTNFQREFVDSAELYDPSTGNWSATGSMNVARFSHTATVLPDGKVLVVGGYGADPDPWAVIKSLNSSELYDPITGTWSMTGAFRDARIAHIAALLLNGKVVIAGGNDGKHGDSIGSAELYDPSTGNWAITGSLSYPNQYFTATTLRNGNVLVAGGLGGPVAQLYDPSTETWSPTGNMNASRQDHTASMLKNGEVLVTGGSTYGVVTNGAELYDPSTETWSITASMNAQRYKHSACTLPSGKVLVVSGWGSPDSAELFSP